MKDGKEELGGEWRGTLAGWCLFLSLFDLWVVPMWISSALPRLP